MNERQGFAAGAGRRWRGLALLGAVAGWIAFAPMASAQDVPAAEREFEEATRQFEARHYQLSLEGFERSYQLMQGHPRQSLILFNIGRAQQELGRYDAAISTYERYLSEAPPDAPFIAEARDHIRDMRGRVGAQGGGGGLGALDVTGIVLIATGGAAALAAIPTGVLALDRQSELDGERCDGTVCDPAAREMIDELDALSTATDVLWIAGVSVAAVGAGLLVAGRLMSGETTASAACTDRGCAATIQGRF